MRRKPNQDNYIMNKLTVLSILSLFLFQCTTDDGFRDVYVELKVDNPDVTVGEIELYLTDINSVGPFLFTVASEAPVTKTSDSYSYEIGTNLTLNRVSASFDAGLTWWADTEITIYSDGKKIHRETYEVGESAALQNKNIVID